MSSFNRSLDDKKRRDEEKNLISFDMQIDCIRYIPLVSHAFPNARARTREKERKIVLNNID